MSIYDRAHEAARRLLAASPLRPSLAVILGSGLGAWADTLDDAVRIPYDSLPGFPPSAVAGHAGQLVLGRRGQVAVAAMQGRAHRYEGHDLADIAFPLRTFERMGIRDLLVTNAAGGVNPEFGPGTLMVIRDHLNLTGQNPLQGPNDERFGPRFPDMSYAYHPAHAELALDVGRDLGIVLREGVYAGVLGPSYETPAEIRMIRALGGDAVGMSTVPEVIVANHMGIRCLGISCITNAAAGLTDAPLDHAEVQEVADRVRADFLRLVDGVVERIPRAEVSA